MNNADPERGASIYRGVFGAVFVIFFLALALSSIRDEPTPGGPALVVYCAHDREYSGQILDRFERETGIPVEARFDAEATKSLGLVELIAAEKDHPRCDVFWNNEPLGTMSLADRGLLEAYTGPGYAATPAAFRDPGGRWTGFAARMRVWIVNTDAMPATPEAVDAAARSADLSRLAIAKALYGTTRMHYTALWDAWGPERLAAWRRDWLGRGVVEVNGNAMVKSLVAAGTCDLGLTDTDDYFAARDGGAPVGMVPFTLDDATPIVIPNTVAIIRGTPRGAEARRLVEYLLSADTQVALARSGARQVPLVAVDDAGLPEEVRALRGFVPGAYPLGPLGAAGDAALAWLKREYLP